MTLLATNIDPLYSLHHVGNRVSLIFLVPKVPPYKYIDVITQIISPLQSAAA